MKQEKRHDIHDYEHRVANAKRVIEQCKSISQNNKQSLLEYAEFKRAQGISLGRIAKFLYTLKVVAVILGKEFRSSEKEDWIRVFDEIAARKLAS